jgi:hypothetical protein
MTIMTPKYNHANDCSEDTPVCSQVTIITQNENMRDAIEGKQ